MRKINGLVLVFCLVLIPMLATGADKKPAAILSVPDCNLIPNNNIQNNDNLLGLFLTKVGYTLLPTRVAVEKGFDDRVNPVMRVTVPSDNRPIFLVSGVDCLQPGPVKTIFEGHKFIYPGESLTLPDMGNAAQCSLDEPFVLKAYGDAVNRIGNSLIYDYSLSLNLGNDVQILDRYKVKPSARNSPSRYAVLNVSDHGVRYDLTHNMELPVLLWAGDMDRDNRPDLFMWWPCPGKEAGVYSLFISSLAEKGSLVAKISAGARTYFDE